MRVSALCASFVLFCSLLPGQSYHIEREWENALDIPQGVAEYRAAVCPDGSFYLANGRREVAVLDAAGRLGLTQKGSRRLPGCGRNDLRPG